MGMVRAKSGHNFLGAKCGKCPMGCLPTEAIEALNE